MSGIDSPISRAIVRAPRRLRSISGPDCAGSQAKKPCRTCPVPSSDPDRSRRRASDMLSTSRRSVILRRPCIRSSVMFSPRLPTRPSPSDVSRSQNEVSGWRSFRESAASPLARIPNMACLRLRVQEVGYCGNSRKLSLGPAFQDPGIDVGAVAEVLPTMQDAHAAEHLAATGVGSRRHVQQGGCELDRRYRADMLLGGLLTPGQGVVGAPCRTNQ